MSSVCAYDFSQGREFEPNSFHPEPHWMPVCPLKEQLTNSLKVTEKRGRNHFLVKLHRFASFCFCCQLAWNYLCRFLIDCDSFSSCNVASFSILSIFCPCCPWCIGIKDSSEWKPSEGDWTGDPFERSGLVGWISPCVIDPSHIKLWGVGQSRGVVFSMLVPEFFLLISFTSL